MNECIPVEQFGTLKALPDDDPRQIHARSCPRCSALLFAYEEFVGAEEVAGADVEAADAALARFIATRIEPGEPGLAPASGRARPGRGRWFDISRAGMLAAVAVVVIIALTLLRWQPWTSREAVYRGESKARFSGLNAARSGDVFTLSWTAVERADGYRVTILAADLREVARLSTIGPSMQFSARDTKGGILPVYWQVTALVEGGELMTSAPQRLP